VGAGCILKSDITTRQRQSQSQRLDGREVAGSIHVAPQPQRGGRGAWHAPRPQTRDGTGFATMPRSVGPPVICSADDHEAQCQGPGCLPPGGQVMAAATLMVGALLAAPAGAGSVGPNGPRQPWHGSPTTPGRGARCAPWCPAALLPLPPYPRLSRDDSRASGGLPEGHRQAWHDRGVGALGRGSIGCLNVRSRGHLATYRGRAGTRASWPRSDQWKRERRVIARQAAVLWPP